MLKIITTFALLYFSFFPLTQCSTCENNGDCTNKKTGGTYTCSNNGDCNCGSADICICDGNNGACNCGNSISCFCNGNNGVCNGPCKKRSNSSVICSNNGDCNCGLASKCTCSFNNGQCCYAPGTSHSSDDFTSSHEDPSGCSLCPDAIAGIVVACVLFVFCVCPGAVYLYRYSRTRRRNDTIERTDAPYEPPPNDGKQFNISEHLIAPAQQQSNYAIQHFRVVCGDGAVVRTGLDLSSAKVTILPPGTLFGSVEQRPNSQNVMRVRVRLGDNSGWVSLRRIDGEPILEVVGGEPILETVGGVTGVSASAVVYAVPQSSSGVVHAVAVPVSETELRSDKSSLSSTSPPPSYNWGM